MASVLAAPDKFRGTATAAQVSSAIDDAARACGWDCVALPVSDGGEGLLECLGGANRRAQVRGPLGDAVLVRWRQDGVGAVIEMAQASGLALVGDNDALAADTTGTGELIAAALDAGCRDIVVGVGGSASTDGGRGALEVLRARPAGAGFGDAQVTVACDVRTTFVDAAAVFAPQKGATRQQVGELAARLDALADDYLRDFGVDVRALPGSGAAGGLAGGLAALGAALRPGFDVVAERIGLPAQAGAADLVITGEGRLDATSLAGKVTGSLAKLCAGIGRPLVVLAGSVADDAHLGDARSIDLSARYGSGAARADVLGCVRTAVSQVLRDTPR